ncbi:hypothetical protein GA830_01255 [Mesorhizobium sp. NBSH29]|uniref:N-acyl amino acid synthase FeeM domain-containing protein n=1 Tax=Mesorhizobium sp. NBSH29 TaxID=2654249 RepID=UPI001896851B|nr:hypothetical protein [Mesorhizobium sp. NBSH29]QPC85522.1 hypothetical protein GA830_01255 [Mesorhizobium sp. NBSH29]
MDGKSAPLGEGRRSEEQAGNTSSFARNVLAALERTEYRRCDKGEDLEDIYKLRYASYRLNNLVPENPDHLVHDPYDDLPNCYRFGIYVDGHLVSTIRLHHVSAATPKSPSMSVYADILQPRLDAGESFIDPSRFAADVEWSRTYPQAPYLTLRLAGMACFYFNAPYCISMIREDHAAFYKRVYQSRPIGEERPYAGVINCYALLYQADVLAIQDQTFQRFPFFKSTPLEQRLMFGKQSHGELAPLTILPTAKYILDAA